MDEKRARFVASMLALRQNTLRDKYDEPRKEAERQLIQEGVLKTGEMAAANGVFRQMQSNSGRKPKPKERQRIADPDSMSNREKYLALAKTGTIPPDDVVIILLGVARPTLGSMRHWLRHTLGWTLTANSDGSYTAIAPAPVIASKFPTDSITTTSDKLTLERIESNLSDILEVLLRIEHIWSS